MWLLFAIVAALLWGLNYTLAEKILDYISPLTLLALEMLVGGLLFSAIAYFTSIRQDFHVLLNEPKILYLTILEIATVILASFCIVYSIQFKNATLAGIVELIYPLFIIFFTWYLFGENHMNWSVVVGGLLIFLGVLIISIP